MTEVLIQVERRAATHATSLVDGVLSARPQKREDKNGRG